MPTTSLINSTHQSSQFANDPRIVAVADEIGVQSVENESELPEKLRYLRDQVPGLLFWHHPLGGGDRVPQYRPNEPGPDTSKYVFPSGAGSVISISPTMQARLEADTTNSMRVLIVEGTKQAIFAAAYAPADVIVVGIQGCWGWSSDGLAVPSLDGLCKSRAVAVAFDADISSNVHVHQAGESLLKHLSTIGAKSVKFIEVPGSQKVGLDDFLARRPVENREEPLANLIAEAKAFNKIKKPLKPRKNAALDISGESFDYISTDLGEVVDAKFESLDDKGQVERDLSGTAVAGKIEGRTVRRIHTLLTAAPRIAAIVKQIDDLAEGSAVEPRLFYDIEGQVGPADSCEIYTVKNVPDAKLNDVRRWLERLGEVGAAIALGRNGQGVSGQTRIAEAMRGTIDSETNRRTALLRTGWYQDGDTAFWVDNGGAHGVNAKTTDIIANLEGSVSGINIPGFSENFSIDDVVESARALLDVNNYLHDPTPWIAGVSGLFWALDGGHPDAVLYLAGGAGSGKSSIAGALASMLGPNWGTGMAPMASVEGTTAYLSDVTRQIHNCPLILDDARDRSSERSQQAQDEAIDAVIRVGYGGGGASRGRKERDADGNWRQSKPSYNRPFVVVVGETIPESQLSTLERCLIIDIKAATSLKSSSETETGFSGHEYLVWLSQNQVLQPVVSYFLQRVAVAMTTSLRGENEAPIASIDEFREYLESVRGSIKERAISKHWPSNVPMSDRSRDVTGTFVAGATLFVDFLRSIQLDDGSRAFSEEELEETLNRWHQAIILAAVGHTKANLPADDDIKGLLLKISDAIASTRYCLGAPADAGKTCLGTRTTVKTDDGKVDAIALIPSVAAQIVGTKRDLKRRLAKILVPANDGSMLRSTYVNGSPTRCLVIRTSDWPNFSDIDNADDQDENPDF